MSKNMSFENGSKSVEMPKKKITFPRVKCRHSYFPVFITNLNENVTTSSHLLKISKTLEKFGGTTETEIFDKQCLKLSMNDWVDTNIHLNQSDEAQIIKLLSEDAQPGQVFSSPGLLQQLGFDDEGVGKCGNQNGSAGNGLNGKSSGNSSLFAVVVLKFGPNRMNCLTNLQKDFGENNVSTVSPSWICSKSGSDSLELWLLYKLSLSKLTLDDIKQIIQKHFIKKPSSLKHYYEECAATKSVISLKTFSSQQEQSLMSYIIKSIKHGMVRPFFCMAENAGFDLSLQEPQKTKTQDQRDKQDIDKSISFLVNKLFEKSYSSGFNSFDLTGYDILPTVEDFDVYYEDIACLSCLTHSEIIYRFKELITKNKLLKNGVFRFISCLETMTSSIKTDFSENSGGVFKSSIESEYENIMRMTCGRRNGELAPEIKLDAMIDSETCSNVGLKQFQEIPSRLFKVGFPYGSDPLYPVKINMDSMGQVLGQAGSYREFIARTFEYLPESIQNSDISAGIFVGIASRSKVPLSTDENLMKNFENYSDLALNNRGIASIIPRTGIYRTKEFNKLQLENLFPKAFIDINVLKKFTIYQIDKKADHVGYFWQVLENFSQAELSQFLRFACNQDTLNQANLGGQPNPPLPMKLAPCNDVMEDDVSGDEDDDEEPSEEEDDENDEEDEDGDDEFEELTDGDDEDEEFFESQGVNGGTSNGINSNSNNSNENNSNTNNSDNNNSTNNNSNTINSHNNNQNSNNPNGNNSNSNNYNINNSNRNNPNSNNSNNRTVRSAKQDKIDQCMIRAETCMFMIKLPAYSSVEIMKKRMRQAISTRYDPLIG